MKIRVKYFNELTISELYQILRLRSEVFVIEQDCVYQDLDNKDQKALHLFFIEAENVVAYTRLFGPGEYFKEASIGRVVVQEDFRKDGLGHKLLEESILTVQNRFNTIKISISAQTYLQKFYKSHDFHQVGDTYLEDGIPHIKMIR